MTVRRYTPKMRVALGNVLISIGLWFCRLGALLGGTLSITIPGARSLYTPVEGVTISPYAAADGATVRSRVNRSESPSETSGD